MTWPISAWSIMNRAMIALQNTALIDENLRDRTPISLPHEFTHSWNGKFRRPADLATPDYHSPCATTCCGSMRVLPEYLGNVLAARSGLWTPEQFREYLAAVMAGLESTAHRALLASACRTTADAAQILYNAPDEWSSWRRGVNYYDEGNFLWLEVDTILRSQSHGKVSLNDFATVFTAALAATRRPSRPIPSMT